MGGRGCSLRTKAVAASCDFASCKEEENCLPRLHSLLRAADFEIAAMTATAVAEDRQFGGILLMDRTRSSQACQRCFQLPALQVEMERIAAAEAAAAVVVAFERQKRVPELEEVSRLHLEKQPGRHSNLRWCTQTRRVLAEPEPSRLCVREARSDGQELRGTQNDNQAFPAEVLDAEHHFPPKTLPLPRARLLRRNRWLSQPRLHLAQANPDPIFPRPHLRLLRLRQGKRSQRRNFWSQLVQKPTK